MEITFDFEKETKGTKRFKERDTEHIGTLYVRKPALAELGDPDVLVVTLKKGK